MNHNAPPIGPDESAAFRGVRQMARALNGNVNLAGIDNHKKWLRGESRVRRQASALHRPFRLVMLI
jgi:hypothetical protein